MTYFTRLLLISTFVLSYSYLFAQCDNQGVDPSSVCDPGVIVCELADYCSEMNPPNPTPSSVTICGAGISLDNPTWFSFIATSNTVTITVRPYDCVPSPQGANFIGMQAAILSGCPTGSTYPTIGNCFNTCQTNNFTLTSSDFVIGGQYFLLLDGCRGSFCRYEILTAQGIQFPDLVPVPDLFGNGALALGGDDVVCPGQIAEFFVDGDIFANSFDWTLTGPGQNASFNTETKTLTFSTAGFAPGGPYTVRLNSAENPCSETGPIANATFSFFVEPLAEVFDEVTVCAANFPFVIDGQTFNGPGTRQYVISSTEGCDSTITLTVNRQLNTPQDQFYVVCEGDFPQTYDFIGQIFTPAEYQINRQDEFGCDSSFIINVQMVQPDFSAFPTSGLSVACPSNPLIMDASLIHIRLVPSNLLINGFISSYTWTFNDTGDIISTDQTASISQGGQYNLTIAINYDGFICDDISIDFFVNEDFPDLGDPEILGPNVACVGQQLTFNLFGVPGNPIIQWIDGSGSIIVGPNNQFTATYNVVSPVGSEQICIYVETRDCPDFFTEVCFDLEISEELEINLGGDLAFCPGGSTTVSVSDYPPSAIVWSDNTTGSNKIYTIPGDYSVTVNDPSGCQGTRNFTIEEFVSPSITFSGSTTFCVGLSTNISIVEDNYTSYIWSNGATSRTVVFNTEGTYNVTVTDQNGCSSERSIEILERDELNPTITASANLCAGTSITLTTDPFAGYTWNGGGTGQSITVSAPGTYSVTVTDNGCEGVAQFNVVLFPNPEAAISSPRQGLCPDESVVISASPANLSYLWSTGATSQTVLIDTAGVVFSVTVTDSNGCSDVTTFEADPYENPVFVINTTDDRDYICAGTEINLVVNPAFSQYNWSTNSSSQNIVVNQAGTFNVTVTNADGCQSQESISIQERANPIPAIGGVLAFCEGTSTTLNVLQDFVNYQWSTTPTVVTPDVVINQPGTYQVTVTDDFGCIGSNSITVIQNNNPVAVISGSSTFCTGFSTRLGVEGSGFTTYNWSGPITASTSTITANIPGQYCVQVTDQNGCISPAACIDVIEDDELSFNLTGTPVFCEGQSTVISGPADFATYTWSNGFIGNNLTVTTPGTYTLTVSDADGCSGSQTVTVIQNDLPVISIEGDDAFCFGGSTILNGSATYPALNWTFPDGSTSAGLTITASLAGLYTLNVTDSNNCSNTAVFTLNQRDQIIPQFNGEALFCEGDQTTISVAGPYTGYLWLDNNSTESTRTFNVGGSFTVQVTDNNNCTGTNSITITSASNPIADAGSDQEFTCQDESLTIGGTTTSVSNTDILWIDLITGDTISRNTAIVMVSTPGQYQIVVVDRLTGCSSSDNVLVGVDENVIRTAEILFEDPACFGETNGSIEILEIVGGTAPYQIRIGGQSTTIMGLNNLPPGTYPIEIMDVNGCDFTTTVTLVEPDQLILNLPDRLDAESGGPITIRPEINIGTDAIGNITWSFNGDLLCTNCSGLDFSTIAERSGIYQLVVTDINGCTVNDQVSISVRILRNVFIPTAFTPNGDGVNDLFRVYTSRSITAINSVEVFDRWGNKVYNVYDILPNQEVGWDGTFRGRKLDPGVFIYNISVSFEDGESFNYFGEVKLMR
jgi:gliding motility-associated-like protein